MSTVALPRSSGQESALTRRRLVLLALTVLVVVVLGALPQYGSAYALEVGYRVAQLAALAQAWNLMAGYGGLVSLAVSAFVGAGSYGGAKLSISAGFGYVPSVLAGGAAAVVLALLVAVPMFRFRGLYFTIGSLVLASALAAFMVNFDGLGGASGLTLTAFAPTATDLYLTAFVIALGGTLATVLLIRGRLGLGLMAVRDDEDVAERMGVATFRTKLVAFAVSGLVMGLIGALQAQKLGRIEPYGAFGLSWTVDAINAAIIGGIGTVLGPLVGAAVITAIAEVLADYPELHVALTGVLLILVIRFAPRGVYGELLARAGGVVVRALPAWLAPRSAGALLEHAPPELPAPDEAAPVHAGAIHRQPAAEARASAPGDVLLSAAGIGRSFGGVRAVHDVSLELRSGEVLGLVGPNGAGKSSLIGLLSGAITSDTGSLQLFGRDATSDGAQVRARAGIGRTHQIPRPFRRLTVLENLLVAQMHGASRSGADARAEAERILALCGLAEQADVPADELTLLRLKRLEVARALALQPRILMLDEVGAGLVEHEVRELIELIRALRTEVEAVLVVEHVLDVIRACCDRLLVLDRGELLRQGTPTDVLADPEVARVYLGTAADAAPGQHTARRAGVGVGGGAPLLEVSDVHAGYGAFRALEGVSLTVGQGEVLALLGANGAGKTTTARVISGMVAPSSGTVRFDGAVVSGRPGHEVVRAGIAHCMEGRRIFADLTVRENLLLGGRTAPSKSERLRRLAEVEELFEPLAEKRDQSGASLSGGQQQMLAIGRALMAAPKLVLFDEISLGLAPIMVDHLYEALDELNKRGLSMIIIEQDVSRGLALADRVAVLERGRVALDGTPDDVRGDSRLRALYVGEAAGATA